MPTSADPSGMLMGVMLVIVSVQVVMLRFGMRVLMPMFFKNEGAQRSSNENHGECLKQRQGFSQEKG
jgi:hypothetical protein